MGTRACGHTLWPMAACGTASGSTPRREVCLLTGLDTRWRAPPAAARCGLREARAQDWAIFRGRVRVCGAGAARAGPGDAPLGRGELAADLDHI